MNARGTVALVTDVERRKAIPIIRSLGRAGVRVLGASSERPALGGFSKYCLEVIRSPNPRTHPDAWLRWLQRTVVARSIDVLHPLEDLTVGLCARSPESWAAASAFLPEPAALERAYDKWETVQAARALGVPVPHTVCPEPHEVAEIARSWQGPAVIKPRKSAGSRGLRFVPDPADLPRVHAEVSADFERPLIQARLPAEGPGLGVFVLLDRALEPRAVFGHRRLREYPRGGGPSTLREGFRDDALIAQSVKLLQRLGLAGIAMVEYKIDARTGVPTLMEINPRYWGSVGLAIASGVDFPMLYHLCALGQTPAPQLDFQPGKRCRWLLPGDMLHFLGNPDRLRLQPSFFKLRGPDLSYDILSRDDPMPSVGILLEAARKLARRER